MSQKQERNKYILAITLVIAVVILGVYKIFFEDKGQEGEKIDTKTISVVKDNSRFFTVASCVSKYINLLSIDDKESVLILLNNKFKDENSITIDNMYNYVTPINGTKSFSPKKMYEQRLSKSVYKYYVYGYIEEETIGNDSILESFYLVVILDEKNMTFAIEPYNGEMFK